MAPAKNAPAALMLHLMRTGAPNQEVLVAKSTDELLDVARRHNIPLPHELQCKLGIAESEELSAEIPVQRAKDQRVAEGDQARSPPPTSGALSRARLWRLQYMKESGEMPDSPAVLETGAQQHADATPGDESSEAPGDVPKEAGVYEGERNEAGERCGDGVCTFENNIVYGVCARGCGIGFLCTTARGFAPTR